MENKIIIDAKDTTLGRLSSYAAKQSLLGKHIVIVNCNSAVIAGIKNSILAKYRQSRTRGSSGLKGPHFPKNPERVVKRTIRGMLSHRQQRGVDAFKRIICYNDTPEEYKGENKISQARPLKVKAITLKELSEKI